MTLLTKRLLIFFSVALNIGFVLFALTTSYRCHYITHEQRTLNELTDIIRSLELPDASEKEALDAIMKFNGLISDYKKDLSGARNDVMASLAQKEEPDRAHLDKLIARVEELEKGKRGMFMAHTLELRKILGNDKGPEFFSRLMKRHKLSENKPGE